MKIDLRKFNWRLLIQVKFSPLAPKLGGKGKSLKWTDEQKKKQSEYIKSVWQQKKGLI